MKRFIPVILLVGLLAACDSRPTMVSTDIASPVSVQEVGRGSISKLINTTGTAMAVEQVTLNSQMEGLFFVDINPATGKPFKMGDKVRKGQSIAHFVDKEYENSTALKVKEMNLEIAKQNLEATKVLFDKGGATQSEVSSSEISLINAENDYYSATLRDAAMRVTATIDGVITNMPHYTQGVKLSSGQEIATIMNYYNMYMEVNLPESISTTIEAGQPVYITHYTLPDDTLKGTLSEISPAISSETRTFLSKITIENPDLLIRPGMFVKGDIIVEQAVNVLVIPKDVVVTGRNRKQVYVVENNTAIMRRITTGLEDSENIEVTGGLNENESLVITGFETLRENAKVKIIR